MDGLSCRAFHGVSYTMFRSWSYHLTPNAWAIHRHVHVHVLSTDLCAPAMKIKKHYNSFHPKHGFFLHFDDVISWFDAEPSYYNTVSLYHHDAFPESQILTRGVTRRPTRVLHNYADV